MYKNIKDGIFKNAKGLIFAASCLLSMSCEAGDVFPPITMGDIHQLDRNLIVDVTNAPDARAPEIMDDRDQLIDDFADRFQLYDDMVYDAISNLAGKHIVGKVEQEVVIRQEKKIEETIGIEWERQINPGGFIAINATNDWDWFNGRFHVAYDLFTEALNGRISHEWTDKDGTRHIQISFNSNYRMFSIRTNAAENEATSPRNVSGIEIRYRVNNNRIVTCFPI